jgi:uncharacterized membrane protein YfcA
LRILPVAGKQSIFEGENAVLKSMVVETFLLTLFLFLFVIEERAYGYLDPGTASYILQLVIGALFGAMFTIKIFWKKIKNFFNHLVLKK